MVTRPDKMSRRQRGPIGGLCNVVNHYLERGKCDCDFPMMSEKPASKVSRARSWDRPG